MTRTSVVLAQPANVQVQVVDVLGRTVATLQDGRMSAGQHIVTFDASGLASGSYFIQAVVPGQQQMTRKVVLVK